MPNYIKPDKLYKICIKFIHNYTEDIFEKRQQVCASLETQGLSKHDGSILCLECLGDVRSVQPISLPNDICQDIINYKLYRAGPFTPKNAWEPIPESQRLLTYYRYFLFLHSDTQKLNIDIENNEELFEQVLLKRCNNIRYLMCSDPYEKLISQFGPNLITLKLENATQKTLQIISANATRLKYLEIEKYATNNWTSIAIMKNMKNLEQIYFKGTLIRNSFSGDEEADENDEKDAVNTLLLPKLTSLRIPNMVDLSTIMEKFVSNYGKIKLNFKELECDDCLEFENFDHFFPELEILKTQILDYSDIDHINDIQNLNHLTDLTLEMEPNFFTGIEFREKIQPVLLNIGLKLKSLNLGNINNIDISVIITFCPNLEKLELIIPKIYEETCQFEFGDNDTKLEYLSLSFQCNSASDVIERLLMVSPRLQYLKLNPGSELSSTIYVYDVISASIITHGFPCLQHILLENIDITVEIAILLLSTRNPLNEIILSCNDFDEFDRRKLINFVKKNNLDVDIKWLNWFR